MAELAGANASPLIVLARAGYFDLLRGVATRVVVPSLVLEETNRRGAADPAVDAMSGASWPEVVIAPAPSPEIVARDLGQGESSLLAWGMANRTARLILDDLAARRCAKDLGLEARGTLWVVTFAKQQGLIPAAAPVIRAVRDAGLYVSEKLVRLVLDTVGESPT